MRHIARTDANQQEIVAAFREMGFSVCLLHQVGNGCPDALLGKHGMNYLVEIKDGNKKLTEAQRQFHETWRGSVFVIRNIGEAFALGYKLTEETWDRNG